MLTLLHRKVIKAKVASNTEKTKHNFYLGMILYRDKYWRFYTPKFLEEKLTSSKVIEQAKLWRKKLSGCEPKQTSSLVRHSGGSVTGIGSLIFTDNVTHSGSSRVN